MVTLWAEVVCGTIPSLRLLLKTTHAVRASLLVYSRRIQFGFSSRPAALFVLFGDVGIWDGDICS